jgi:hypothetical protein
MSAFQEPWLNRQTVDGSSDWSVLGNDPMQLRAGGPKVRRYAENDPISYERLDGLRSTLSATIDGTVVFEVDSDENVTKNFEGDYFLPLRYARVSLIPLPVRFGL